MKRLATISILLLSAWAAPAAAQAPAAVPVQGYLTDDGGTPITSTVSLLVALYDTETGGSPVFSETHEVTPDNGFFALHIGSETALDLAIFRDNASLLVSISIDGGPELEPRMPLETVPYAAFAAFAGDAATVGGQAATSFAASTVGAGLTIDGSREISLDTTVVQSAIDTSIGALGDGNPINHARYTDAEAVAAVAAADSYVRNDGDTVAGNLTVNGTLTTTGSVAQMQGGLRWNCPTGMTRVGAWCMANLRAQDTFTNAVADCDSRGLTVCPVEAIVQCDMLERPANCALDTDPIDAQPDSFKVMTGTIEPPGQVVQRVVFYYARLANVEDSVSIENGNTRAERYYCCAPIHGL